ncbi:MAG: hypothetical protein QOJ65_2295 [Fimbriimonadaceae bacterium]|jgi:hypothetical protein|nr:hypothetical protein [Fimbriimonadaceae bacterium]
MNINKFSRTAVLAASAVFAASAMAQGGISVIIDGRPVAFRGTGPQQVNGRVLVPLRGVLEQMGAYVDWQPAGQLVTAQKSGTNIELRIGDRMARVNDRPVTLDVPAMIVRGNTMVPLRFMSEALGAEVKWEPSQYAVLINTADTGTRGQTYYPGTNPLPADLRIDALDMNRTGWVTPGSQIRFTLRGTPGGVATLAIPGETRDITMFETSPGVYEATWTVPDTQGRVNASRINPVARLKVGNNERVFQSTATANVDVTAPLVRAMTPDDQTTVLVSRPTISAVFDDTVGSGIDPSSVRLTLDGRDVTPDATVTANFISYTPAVGLDARRHDVKLTGLDMAGNRVTKTWSFRVGTDGEQMIRSFNVTGVEGARPGDVLKFTLMAAPGGRATFSLGDIVRNRPMEEREPGRYVGNYTIRRGDDLVNQPITARFVARSGEVYTVQSTDRVDVNGGPLESPTILSPRADTPIRNPMVIEGRAPANSRVLVRVDYSTSVLGAARLNGAVTEVVVVADENGRFRTDPIDLRTLIKGSDTRYTVTATTLGTNDRKSEPTTITVSK